MDPNHCGDCGGALIKLLQDVPAELEGQPLMIKHRCDDVVLCAAPPESRGDDVKSFFAVAPDTTQAAAAVWVVRSDGCDKRLDNRAYKMDLFVTLCKSNRSTHGSVEPYHVVAVHFDSSFVGKVALLKDESLDWSPIGGFEGLNPLRLRRLHCQAKALQLCSLKSFDYQDIEWCLKVLDRESGENIRIVKCPPSPLIATHHAMARVRKDFLMCWHRIAGGSCRNRWEMRTYLGNHLRELLLEVLMNFDHDPHCSAFVEEVASLSLSRLERVLKDIKLDLSESDLQCLLALALDLMPIAEFLGSPPLARPADGCSHAVLVIGPGFGIRPLPEQLTALKYGGRWYQEVVICHCSDPESQDFNMEQGIRQLKMEIERLGDRLAAVVCASKGGVYMPSLWDQGHWRGPSVIINAHAAIKKLPLGMPVVLTHGSRDSTFPRIHERQYALIRTAEQRKLLLDVFNIETGHINHDIHLPAVPGYGDSLGQVLITKGSVVLKEAGLEGGFRKLINVVLPVPLVFRYGREDLEKLIRTGTPGMCYLYLSATGYNKSTMSGSPVSFQPGQPTSRLGDEHDQASLRRFGCLSRLVDGAISRRPEMYMIETSTHGWQMEGRELDLAQRRHSVERQLGWSPFLWHHRFCEAEIYGASATLQKVKVPEGSNEFNLVMLAFGENRETRTHCKHVIWELGDMHCPCCDHPDSNVKIEFIERIEHPGNLAAIEAYYHRVRTEVEAQNENLQGGVHARWLFHRPQRDAAAAIMNDYFRPSCTERNMWGQGVNFARDAVYSDGFDGTDDSNEPRQIFLNLVVVGLFCLGDPSYTQPPLFGSSPVQRYHSLVDDLSNPEIFVLADSAPVAAMPGYVITYRKNASSSQPVAPAAPPPIPIGSLRPSHRQRTRRRAFRDKVQAPTPSGSD